MNRLLGTPIAVMLLLAGCTAAPVGALGTETPIAELVTTEGEVILASGAAVTYRCIGEGEPAMLIEAGTDTPGTQTYITRFLAPIAEERQVCTYDRLGTGLSDDAPEQKRTIDDLCDVQDEVRALLGLDGPVVLAGQSGGANLVIWCAARAPDAVASLISIEGYHDNPTDLAAEGLSDWTANPEHMDWVESSQMLDTIAGPIGTFPVLVISANGADPGGPQNQEYWLALSETSRQVIMDGGHNLHQDAPEDLSAEIVAELTGL
jgi:pimeloyl-ACP methyl ester carboxylesterase